MEIAGWLVLYNTRAAHGAKLLPELAGPDPGHKEFALKLCMLRVDIRCRRLVFQLLQFYWPE